MNIEKKQASRHFELSGLIAEAMQHPSVQMQISHRGARHIFSKNSSELIDYVQWLTAVDTVEEFMYRMEPERQSEIFNELARLIHNFSSGYASLVDYIRKEMRINYDGTDFIVEYQQRIDADFAQDPEAQFLNRLRNYLLHNKVEFPGLKIAYERNQLPDPTVYFDPEKLLQAGDYWNEAAKVFLDKHIAAGGKINVIDFVQLITEKVDGLHDWIAQKHQELNLEVIELPEKLRQEQREIIVRAEATGR